MSPIAIFRLESRSGEADSAPTAVAEIDLDAGINQAWFIGFAPADDPQIAVAATIAKGIVTAHGGEISASSQPGKGSAITFTLPRS